MSFLSKLVIKSGSNWKKIPEAISVFRLHVAPVAPFFCVPGTLYSDVIDFARQARTWELKTAKKSPLKWL
jgi:hypothetical protein